MYVYRGNAYSLAIMIDNDILQTKYVASIYIGTTTSIGDSLHIVIENVTKNMDTTLDDAKMKKEYTTVTIGSGSDSSSYGTWTSTIESNNVTVELECEVVEVNGDIVTAKCDSDNYWPDSVFNRIPMWMEYGNVYFGFGSGINSMLFGTNEFKYSGTVPSEWKQYNVTGHESNLTFGNQCTIMGLPESFVSYWVDMGAHAYLGNLYAMLVPHD